MWSSDPSPMELWEVLDAVIIHLEEQAATASASKRSSSEGSSVVNPGPAERPLPLLGANPATKLMLSALMAAITDFFKSIGYMQPELEATYPSSSTLKLTLSWHSAYTETITDGDRGPASREDVTFRVEEAGE